MNLQNTPWDYQEHDRIISILAWVVVVVLVIYASVFFYKQITTAPERPHDLTLAQGSQPVTATAPPALPPVEPAEPVEPAQPPPVEPPPVKPPVVTEPVKPPPVKPPVVATRPPPVAPPVKPPPSVVPTVTSPPPVAPPRQPEQPVVKPPVADEPPVEPPPVTPPPKGERMTLKIGTFVSAGEAVRSGVGLGIDGHTFSPVRDPLTNRYTLHFGEFTGWKDAIVVMDKIRAKDASLDVVVWPLPTGAPVARPEPRQAAVEQPPSEPAPRPVAAARPAPAPVRPPKPVEPEPAEPAETARPVRHAGPTGPYVVRVASYRQVGNATGMVRTLLEQGYRASMDETTVKGERWYRVHATGFDTLGEARDARQRIVSLSKSADGAVVVKVP